MGAFDFFVSRGWTDYQAAAIVGNSYGESTFNHRAVGDGGRAFGLFQWHPDRQENFRRVMGVDIRSSSPQQQWAFADWELRNTERRAGQALRSTTNVRDATWQFMKKFERPADNSSFGKRLAAATRVLGGGEGLLKKGAASLGLDLGSAVTAGANAIVPGSGMVLDALGMGADSCGIICQIQNWIKDSGFFQRLALAILAFIILFASFYMMKGNVIQGVISKGVKQYGKA